MNAESARTITVRYFAALREALGTDAEQGRDVRVGAGDVGG